MFSKFAVPIVLLIMISLYGVTSYADAPHSGKDAATRKEELVKVEITFVVVDDLSPRPVPLTDIRFVASDKKETVIRTDEKGVARLELPPGKYVAESVRPVNFKGKLLNWKIPLTIPPGVTFAKTLTDSDATFTATENGGRKVSEEANIYQAVKAGVVSVESDWGSGSGFIVDKRGLIITNHHVVDGTRFLSIRFGRGERYEATVVSVDKDADIAVIAFNPETNKSFVALKLADITKGLDVTEGERVLAIGSPLRQEKILTTGIISKVEKDVLISDVNINHGNSGGPLLNLAGEVIGVSTFLDSAQNGPGISGIVAIQKAAAALQEARTKIGNLALPPVERLPDISPIAIPASALDAAEKQDRREPPLWRVPVGFETRVFTPLYFASYRATLDRELNRRQNARVGRRDKNGIKEEAAVQSNNRFWTRYAIGNADPVVMIECRPGLHETNDSKARGFFGALAGVRTKKKDAYTDDFYDMELYRGGKRIEPIRRLRVTMSQMFDGWDYEVTDRAIAGFYLYDPAVFEPSEPVTVVFRAESDIKKRHEWKLKPDFQKRIYDEYASYFAALQNQK